MMPSRRIYPIALFAVLLLAGSVGGTANGDPSGVPGQTAPTNVSPPTISGTPVVGETLTGTTGDWSGPVDTLAYQWERCESSGTCSAIADATGTTYVLATADLGTTTRLTVVATNKNGATTAASGRTAVIQLPVTSTTSTTTPSSGNLLWSADFESGNLGAFRGVHTGLPTWGNSSATVVPQGGQILGLNSDGPWSAPPPQQGKYSVGLLTDGPSSATGTAGGQRAELTTGYLDTPNTERWYGLCAYVPSVPNEATGIQDNAVWETGWGTSLDFKISGANSRTGDNNSFQFANGAAISTQKNGWTAAWYHVAPLVYDQWVCFTIHVYWSTGSSGYFEIYENGKLLTLTGLSYSFSGTRVSGPNYGVQNQMDSEFDVYRNPQTYPNLLYFDSLKIGDTYAVVQPG